MFARWGSAARTRTRARASGAIARRQLSVECLESRLLLTFTPLPLPDAAYLSSTTEIPITVPDSTSVSSLADSNLKVFFSTALQAATVPSTWATWGSPPQTENATPRVLVDSGTTVTLSFSKPVGTFGVEMEPNVFATFTMTADFYNGSTLVGEIPLPVAGQAGARLFAGASTDEQFTDVVLSAPAEAQGFAIAAVRYAACQLSVNLLTQYDPRWAKNLYDNSTFLTTKGNLTAGSKTVLNLGSTTGVDGDEVDENQLVTGQGIPPNTTVADVSGNTVTLSAAATATGTATISFSYTIMNSGCALTALAMALNFAGAATDPGTLNQLMIAKGGYAGSIVDWVPATRAEGKAAGLPLKYTETSPPRSSSLDTLNKYVCQQGHPVIVSVDSDGHFVLVTGMSGDTYTIKDPGHADRTTLQAYGNKFVTRGYVSDPADFSGLDISVVAPRNGVNVAVADPQGRITGIDPVSGQELEQIPGGAYYVDTLEVDPDVTSTPPTQTAQFVDTEHPSAGAYFVSVTSPTPALYTLYIHSYATDGSERPPVVVTGLAGPGGISQFEVIFDPRTGQTTQVVRQASFSSTTQDIANAFALNLIDNQGIENSLNAEVTAASAAASRGDVNAERTILGALSAEITAQTGQHITSAASTILLGDVAALQQAIPPGAAPPRASQGHKGGATLMALSTQLGIIGWDEVWP